VVDEGDFGVEAVDLLVQVERELVVRGEVVVAGAVEEMRLACVARRVALVAVGAYDALGVAVAAA
jgi:hypothetical protein